MGKTLVLRKRKWQMPLLCLLALLFCRNLFLINAKAAGLYEIQLGTVGSFTDAPAGAVFTSSDSEVVQIVNNEIHAVGVGLAIVTAKGKNSQKKYQVGVELTGKEKKYSKSTTLRTAINTAAEKNKKSLHAIVTIPVTKNDAGQVDDTNVIDEAVRAFFPKEDDYFVAYSDSFTLRYAIVARNSEKVQIHATVTFHYNPASAVAASYRGEKVNMTKEEKILYQRCEKVIADLKLKSKKSNYEKALLIHDYIVKNCAFDLEATELEEGWWESQDSYTAYGALINGKATCKGYAQAMKLLLNAVDVPCDYLVGWKTVRHGWNRIQMDDGKWYHVDASSDDPVPDKKNRVLHTYFGLTDKQMKKTHHWDDDGKYCQSTAYSYAKKGALK